MALAVVTLSINKNPDKLNTIAAKIRRESAKEAEK